MPPYQIRSMPEYRDHFIEFQIILPQPIFELETWIEHSKNNPNQFIVLKIPRQWLDDQGFDGDIAPSITHIYFYFKPQKINPIIDRIKTKIMELIV